MPIIEVGDRKVEYVIEGAGDRVVVLSSPTWWPLDAWALSGIPQLRDRFRVLAFNHRGIGESEGTPGDYDADLLAGDMGDLMSALGIERADVVGFAIGSAVALHAARNAPGRVSSLVLAAMGADSSARREREEFLQPLRDEIASMTYPAYIRHHADGSGFAFDPDWLRDHQSVAADLGNALWEHAGTQDEFLKHALARQTSRPQEGLGDLRAPTLVMVGEDDNAQRGPSMPVDAAQLLAGGIPGAELAAIPRARHMFFWQEPDACWARVIDFLTSHGG